LKLHTKTLTSSLKNLQDRKIVKAVSYHPVEFSAVPFEKAIDLLIEVKKRNRHKASRKGR